MIKNGIKNYIKNFKYFFTPLGAIALGVVFGLSLGIPIVVDALKSLLDMIVKITEGDAVGYNILWGSDPEKLYHSYMIFGKEQRVGALVKGTGYYVRVDAFNENGITEGNTVRLFSK